MTAIARAASERAGRAATDRRQAAPEIGADLPAIEAGLPGGDLASVRVMIGPRLADRRAIARVGDGRPGRRVTSGRAGPADDGGTSGQPGRRGLRGHRGLQGHRSLQGHRRLQGRRGRGDPDRRGHIRDRRMTGPNVPTIERIVPSTDVRTGSTDRADARRTRTTADRHTVRIDLLTVDRPPTVTAIPAAVPALSAHPLLGTDRRHCRRPTRSDPTRSW
jgi:hypothetical protein